MAAIQITFTVDDVQTILGLYDQIQVWRSKNGSDGTYSEITAADPTSAILDGAVQGPWSLAGAALTIALSHADPVSVSFAGVLELGQLVTAINTVVPGLASEITTGANRIRLTSPITGTGSSIQVGGSAAPILGLSTLLVDGCARRIALTPTTSIYRFVDLDGDAAYYYKTRFYSSKTRAASTFGPSRRGDVSTTLPSTDLVKATCTLVDGAGRPVTGRRIILAPVTSRVIAGVNSSYSLLAGFDRIVITTDQNGYAETYLVKGETFRVFFEGSPFNREFIVPETDFDLLSTLSTKPDTFSIVQAPPMPIRMS